jgi:protein-tyrosine phosphatase
MNPKAVAALTSLGFSLSRHSSTPVSAELLDKADMVLTFTQEQKHLLEVRNPLVANKCFTMSQYANMAEQVSIERNPDVEDPYGKSEQVYRETAETINSLLEVIVSSLAKK